MIKWYNYIKFYHFFYSKKNSKWFIKAKKVTIKRFENEQAKFKGVIDSAKEKNVIFLLE